MSQDQQSRRNQDGEIVMRSVLKGARVTLSRQGRGVYVIHESTDRVTRRPENLPSALQVGEFLMEIPSPAVSDRARREGLSGYFYRIALRLHSFGRPDLARRALRQGDAEAQPAPAASPSSTPGSTSWPGLGDSKIVRRRTAPPGPTRCRPCPCSCATAIPPTTTGWLLTSASSCAWSWWTGAPASSRPAAASARRRSSS